MWLQLLQTDQTRSLFEMQIYRTRTDRVIVTFQNNRLPLHYFFVLDYPSSTALVWFCGKRRTLSTRTDRLNRSRFTKMVLLLPPVAGACSVCRRFEDERAFTSVRRMSTTFHRLSSIDSYFSPASGSIELSLRWSTCHPEISIDGSSTKETIHAGWNLTGFWCLENVNKTLHCGLWIIWFDWTDGEAIERIRFAVGFCSTSIKSSSISSVTHTFNIWFVWCVESIFSSNGIFPFHSCIIFSRQSLRH